ncbi:hypothetical protein ACJJTC_010033 [Scirpophaga incertulas]
MYVLYDNFNLWLVASVFVGAIARLTDDPRGLNGTPENNNTEFENIEEKGQIDDLVLNRDLNYKENIDTHNENVIHRESDISNGSRPELRSSTRKKKENHKSLKQQKQKKRVLFENDETAPKRSKSRRGQKSKISALCDDVVNHEESDDVGAGPSFKRSTRGRKQTKRVIFDDDEDLDDPYANKDCEEDDPACIYCNELFSQSRPKEHWVKCQLCSNWCHTLCAGIPARKKQFICELCS